MPDKIVLLACTNEKGVLCFPSDQGEFPGLKIPALETDLPGALLKKLRAFGVNIREIEIVSNFEVPLSDHEVLVLARACEVVSSHEAFLSFASLLRAIPKTSSRKPYIKAMQFFGGALECVISTVESEPVP